LTADDFAYILRGQMEAIHVSTALRPLYDVPDGLPPDFKES